MGLTTVGFADLTVTADPWRLNMPYRRAVRNPDAHGGQTLAYTPPAQEPAYFPLPRFLRRDKLPIGRRWNYGGNKAGRPILRPSPDDPRTSAAGSRRSGTSPGVTPYTAGRMPSGLTVAAPLWESHLFGSDGYLADT